ncbi:MAG: ABC transporter ATP-binding protein [Planctomycetota bacterium]
MLLSASDLRSGYGTSDVLQDVGVTVEQGEVVGVLGRNGVGKTTLMKTLIGLLPARAGQIVFRDQDVTKLSADTRARLGIGYVPQGRGIFPYMTVRDNLRMGGLINASRTSLDFDLVFGYFPFLKERLAQRGGTLSGGQQAMLAIARALISWPDLLLLDEPSDGVQPSIVEEIGDFIKSLNEEKGLTVLIVEQNIDLMQTVAKRAYALDKGRVVASVNREDLLDTQRVASFLAI